MRSFLSRSLFAMSCFWTLAVRSGLFDTQGAGQVRNKTSDVQVKNGSASGNARHSFALSSRRTPPPTMKRPPAAIRLTC